MSHKAYLLITTGMPLNHHALFILTNLVKNSGLIYEVHGNIQEGMTYRHEAREDPEALPNFEAKQFLGTVAVENLEEVDAVSRKVPSPEKQFQGARRLRPEVPLRRCQEWASEAIAQLKNSDVLITDDVGVGEIQEVQTVQD